MDSLHKEHKALIKDSTLLMVSSLVTGLLYSSIHIVLLGRMNKISYAMLASLLALLKVMSVPSSALMTSIARYTSQLVHEQKVAVWVTIVKRASRKLVLLGLLALGVWCLMSGLIKDWMGVPSRLNIMLLGLVAFLGLFVPVVQGVLQGSRKFGWQVASDIGNAFTRALLCILALIVFGSHVSPMLAAASIGVCVGLAIGVWPFRTLMRSVKAIENFDTGAVYRYFWPVLLGQGAVFFLVELDLILAPRCLEADQLAAYCAAAMLTRCIFMLTQPLATALFPRAVVKSQKWMVLGSLALSFSAAMAAACLVYFFAEIPVRLILKEDAPIYSEILKLYVWAALPFSMMSIMTPYLWARNRLNTVLWLVPVALLYAGLRLKFSGSPEEMIACLAVVTWLSVVVLGAALIKELRHQEAGEGENNGA